MSQIGNPSSGFGPVNLANPTASVGLTAVNGSALTAMRSDGAPPLDQTKAFKFTGLDDTVIAAGKSLTVDTNTILTDPINHRVGLGRTPSYLLDVNTQARISGSSGPVGTIGGADYSLSLQNNAATNYLEILNNGGTDKGAFFGMNVNDFELWNFQDGNIKFILGNLASALEYFRISKSGSYTLTVTSRQSGGTPVKQFNTSASGFAGFDMYEANGSTYKAAFGYGNSSSGAPYAGNAYVDLNGIDFAIFNSSAGTELFRAQAAGDIRLGGPAAASPGSKVLKVQNAATGNNNGAATFTLIASLSVGTGISGDLVFQTGVNGNGSGVLATPTTALTIKGETQDVVIAAGKTFQIGNAATTGLVAGVLAATTNASIVITDSGGQAYRIPCII